MKDLKWPVAAVIGILVVVLGTLSYFDKDTSTVLASVIAVLSALGFGYQFSKTSEIAQSTARIEENTNGRMSQMARELEAQRLALASANDRHHQDMKQMADKMALMIPAPLEPPTSGIPVGESHSANI
jgi:hypothetical protein